MKAKADLHVHSQYSDRPTEWVLRRIGAPECYTKPRAVYDLAKRRGMDFVTISDHNCIDGAAEIAHLPGAFVSNEITTYFPDDRCKVHVLAWNITQAQFNEIQRLRENIVDLRDYMHAEGIVHSCAHPLYSINDRLSIDHFERLLLLFNVFETMNGARNRRSNDLVRAVLDHLTQEQFEEIASRHGISPVGDAPWLKGGTGGSDDHSGVFVAKAYTECPASGTVRDFLGHVALRQSTARGLDGTPLSFAHGLYTIAFQYYRDKLRMTSGNGSQLMLKLFGEVLGPEQTRVGFRDRVSYYARRIAGRPDYPAEVEFKRMVSTEMVKLFGEDWLRDDFVVSPERHDELNRRTFELASRIANQLSFQFTRKFVEKLSMGSIFGSIEALSAAGPLLLGVAPYLFAFAHQSRDRHFLASVNERFLGGRAPSDPAPRKAWFVDALTDVNGVTTLVRKMCRLADEHRHDLTLVTFSDVAPDRRVRAHNFTPVGQFALPENSMINLAFPPFLDVLEYCDREQFTELVVSTPSLAGLAAVAAARMLNIRLVGIYHTDLPQYIRYYTEDEQLESATWRYLRWFYDQMDLVYVPSRGYRNQLIAKGFDARRLRMLPHGIDVDRFHPSRHDPAFWQRFGVNGGPKVTYVGRAAKEKDLDILVEVYEALARRRPDCTLVIVGDGPFLTQMKNRLRHANVIFTGFLFDADLSSAYAGSDVFVFPSTTDTFGNVVLEAMASGVPVVVSDRGGPAEFVEHGVTGFVTKARNVADVLAAIERLLDDADLRRRMSASCRAYAETCRWDRIYLEFWRGEATSTPAELAAPV
ncbi:MAG TPA: glycosyltransferase [Vicinamibacterales bacterium]|nr:glycosyltransferase [Vicinamibacterales bacterium]